MVTLNKCEKLTCVFNYFNHGDSKFCILDEIELDSSGTCKHCSDDEKDVEGLIYYED